MFLKSGLIEEDCISRGGQNIATFGFDNGVINVDVIVGLQVPIHAVGAFDGQRMGFGVENPLV